MERYHPQKYVMTAAFRLGLTDVNGSTTFNF
jgi:hypothetical protein